MKVAMQEQEAERDKVISIYELNERLQAARNANDENRELELLMELGHLYSFHSDYTLSDDIYKQAIAIARHISEKTLECVAFANLGYSFVRWLDFEKARSNFESALS